MSALAKTAGCRGDHDLESKLSDQLQFAIDDIVSNVESLSKHRYGCRVVQRAIEFCIQKQKSDVLNAVIACHKNLVHDQYGNYVVQQTLACGDEVHQGAILKTLIENESFPRLSKHKYASNVVEGMLKHGTSAHKQQILEELLKVS